MPALRASRALADAPGEYLMKCCVEKQGASRAGSPGHVWDRAGPRSAVARGDAPPVRHSGAYPLSAHCPMAWLATKYLITAALVVLISETARRSDRLGGLIAALPLVTVLTLVWLYAEKQPAERISNHAYYTFWYVLATLPMFALFPAMHRHWGFWGALAGSAVLTMLCFILLAWVMRRFGVELL